MENNLIEKYIYKYREKKIKTKVFPWFFKKPLTNIFDVCYTDSSYKLRKKDK